MSQQMFVYIKNGITEAQKKTYENYIVFDEKTGTIWTHGKEFGSVEEALAELKYFSSVAGNSGTVAGAAKPGQTLNIKGTGAISTSVGEDGVTISYTGATTDTVTTVSNSDGSITVGGSGHDYVVSTDGSKVKLGATVTAASSASDLAATDSVNSALGKILKKINDVSAATGAIEIPVNSVEAASNEKAIKVTDTEGDITLELKTDNSGEVQFSQTDNGLKGNVTIPTYTTKSGEKVLDLNGTELSTTLTIKYNNQKMQLIGKDEAVISETDLPTSLFQDQYLKNVTYNDSTHKLSFTFNVADGTAITDVDLSGLVDRYEAGKGIEFGDSTDGSVKAIHIQIADNSEEFLTVDADGLKLDGIQDAIDAATANQVTAAANLAANQLVTGNGTKGVQSVAAENGKMLVGKADGTFEWKTPVTITGPDGEPITELKIESDDTEGSLLTKQVADDTYVSKEDFEAYKEELEDPSNWWIEIDD